jgi:hypothetical protein
MATFTIKAKRDILKLIEDSKIDNRTIHNLRMQVTEQQILISAFKEIDIRSARICSTLSLVSANQYREALKSMPVRMRNSG